MEQGAYASGGRCSKASRRRVRVQGVGVPPGCHAGKRTRWYPCRSALEGGPARVFKVLPSKTIFSKKIKPAREHLPGEPARPPCRRAYEGSDKPLAWKAFLSGTAALIKSLPHG